MRYSCKQATSQDLKRSPSTCQWQVYTDLATSETLFQKYLAMIMHVASVSHPSLLRCTPNSHKLDGVQSSVVLKRHVCAAAEQGMILETTGCLPQPVCADNLACGHESNEPVQLDYKSTDPHAMACIHPPTRSSHYGPALIQVSFDLKYKHLVHQS